MTEPEQWAVELRQEVVSILFHPDSASSDAEAAKKADLAIQRAFEERERKWKDANPEIARLKNVRAISFEKIQILESSLKDIASRAHACLARVNPSSEDTSHDQ